MSIFLFLLLMKSAQPVFGPVTDCPLVVEVVDMSWSLLPGIEVTVRDERTRTTQSDTTNESGRVKFTVQSCPDTRCRFTISAGQDSGFKTVTLKRLWFGKHQNDERHVQIRLANLSGPTIRIH
jgi:hypothetical protein